jgi:type II secretory pathway pseudopilin PulG
MQNRGYTIRDLLLIVSVLTIIACLAVPSMVASQRASNERNASLTLRTMGSVEITYKTSGSGVGGYWTRDVAGLYYTPPCPLIGTAVCLADGNNLTLGPQGHESSPWNGYWIVALSRYETSETDLEGRPYGVDRDRFGFIAVPSRYGISGTLVFILNESCSMRKRDPGSGVWTVPPKIGVPRSGGILEGTPGRAYGTFPINPGNFRGRCPGPWSTS